MKLVKPARVPTWTKTMTLDKYLKSLEVWMQQNRDVEEHVKFNEVIESLKNNKEVNSLEKYVCDHILSALDTIEVQTVQQIVGILKRKYGRTRMEEMEELVTEWMNFKANDHEEEDEYLLAIEKLYTRKEALRIKDKEWFSVWMMIQTRKRKGIEEFQLQGLRDIVKQGGDEVMTGFREK